MFSPSTFEIASSISESTASPDRDSNPVVSVVSSPAQFDEYERELAPDEVRLYAELNRLDDTDPEQLARRMVTEAKLNAKQLRRWEKERGAGAVPVCEAEAAFGRLDPAAHTALSERCTVVCNLKVDPHGYLRRYRDNAATDERLVNTHGTVGASCFDPTTFCNAVLTHSPERPPVGTAGVLQVQGTNDGEGIDRLLQTALRFGKRAGADGLVFINLAQGQIGPYLRGDWAHKVRACPVGARPFKTCLSGAVGSSVGRESYLSALYFGDTTWPDGLIVSPSALQSKIEALLLALQIYRKPLLIIGCNAGKDRSGIINALLRLALQWREAGEPRAVLEDVVNVVRDIEAGRPEALRSAERRQVLLFTAERLADAKGPQVVACRGARASVNAC